MGLKWVKTIKINNFLTHKDTEIHLDRGINVFVGDSNAGKSACIKALRWLFYNEPRGDGFIRYDQERLDIEAKQKKNKDEYKCSVSVEMSDGIIIERSQSLSPASNKYIIYKPGEYPLVLTGFGRDVPEEVSNAIGFSALALGSRGKFEINYMPQLGEPAALAFQGEELSRTLNFAHSLDQFEEVLSRISTKLHPSSAIAGGIRTFEERLKIKNLELSKLPDKTSALEKSKEIKKYILKIQELEQKIELAEKYIEELNDINDKKEKIIKNIDKNNEILSIKYEKIHNDIIVCIDSINLIREYQNNNINIEKILELNKNNEIISTIDYKSIDDYFSFINDAISAIGEVNFIYNHSIEIDNKLLNINRIVHIDTISDIETLISNASCGYDYVSDFMKSENRKIELEKESGVIESKISDNIDKLNNLVSEFVEILSTEGLCPTCFSQIDSDSAKVIADKYISTK